MITNYRCSIRCGAGYVGAGVCVRLMSSKLGHGLDYEPLSSEVDDPLPAARSDSGRSLGTVRRFGAGNRSATQVARSPA